MLLFNSNCTNNSIKIIYLAVLIGRIDSTKYSRMLQKTDENNKLEQN